MPLRDIHKRLTSLEHVAIDLAISKAIAVARSGPRDQFAATLLARLPAGPEPGTIWLNVDLLSPNELLLVAQMDHRRSDPALLTYDQLQRIVAGAPCERVMQPMSEA
jgi:hypothetical protein